MAPEVILAMDEGTYNGKVRDFTMSQRHSLFMVNLLVFLVDLIGGNNSSCY